MDKTKKTSIFFLIFLSCAIYAVSGGLRSNFGVIINSIAQWTGLKYSDAAFSLGIMQLMYGVTQPLWGIVALKKGNSFILIIGIPLLAAGLLATPFCSSVLLLTIFLGVLFGTGSGALCYGMIMGALAPLIGKERASAASGILNASSGIGGAVLSPIIQMLNVSFGLGGTMAILCLPLAALTPAVIWIRNLNKKKETEASESDKNHSEKSPLPLLKRAFADADYRGLMIGFGTCGFHMCIIQTHMISQFVSYGTPETTAVLIYTIYGIAAMAGSILSGFLCTKFRQKNVLGSIYFARVFIVLVFILSAKTLPFIWTFALLLGFTGDATVTPTSEIISGRYGAYAMSFLFGITFVTHQIGGFISSWLGGILITEKGNYIAIWIIDIVLCAVAALVSYKIRAQKKKSLPDAAA